MIFISAYGRDQLVARALEAGAEDYIVKPFSPTELVARIHTALRRQTGPETDEPSGPYVLGDLTINYAERRVYLAGNPVPSDRSGIPVPLRSSRSMPGSCRPTSICCGDCGVRAIAGHSGPIRTVVKNLRSKLGDPADRPLPTSSMNRRVGYRMERGETTG